MILHNHRCALCGNLRTVFEVEQCSKGIAEDICDCCMTGTIELAVLTHRLQVCETNKKRDRLRVEICAYSNEPVDIKNVKAGSKEL
jgi:hypothetical protein